jgi:hypothetical protein
MSKKTISHNCPYLNSAQSGFECAKMCCINGRQEDGNDIVYSILEPFLKTKVFNRLNDLEKKFRKN